MVDFAISFHGQLEGIIINQLPLNLKDKKGRKQKKKEWSVAEDGDGDGDVFPLQTPFIRKPAGGDSFGTASRLFDLSAAHDWISTLAPF